MTWVQFKCAQCGEDWQDGHPCRAPFGPINSSDLGSYGAQLEADHAQQQAGVRWACTALGCIGTAVAWALDASDLGRLSSAASRQIAEMLTAPPEPSPALVELLKRKRGAQEDQIAALDAFAEDMQMQAAHLAHDRDRARRWARAWKALAKRLNADIDWFVDSNHELAQMACNDHNRALDAEAENRRLREVLESIACRCAPCEHCQAMECVCLGCIADRALKSKEG